MQYDHLIDFMDRLGDFLYDYEDEPIEEVIKGLKEEMGEEEYLKAEKDFFNFIERLKTGNKND